ncbi:DUF3037 domain-containing protein [Hymenobacter sp. BT770]|uniref:DUF3037 domain-containing protein n=1 Tax=Hymenobacter sp. BT770 TaxID=2886942 RepID=UPI001D116738|nr:DUF3037 domain-containing protein [Hymenobacter sp. BT770]MCC3151638.1 DUF3037 domain-containing protein [Hymenobacter sp. BT770]MDO3413785.1 DUF3037 domain-containing protein [Hymenobacter sp. BT770]
MPDKHLFEYAVLRVVPRVEREEFLNVGVIVYCRSLGFLQTRHELPEARLRAFADGLDLDELNARLHAFERICQGRTTGGTIGQFPIAERFRWLTATRSTIVQTSPVHPGLCTDAAETLTRLFAQLVQ